MNKNKMILFVFMLSTSKFTEAVTFNEAAKSLSTHESVQSMENLSLALRERAKESGSWGDPTFSVIAKNFPKKTLKKNQTPMTGIEFGISQKVSLTTKYGNFVNAGTASAKAREYKARDRQVLLTKSLWEIVIVRKKILDELQILKENNQWIIKILKISKKLYANGRTSQQALLELEIRKSELEIALSNKTYTLSQLDDKLEYLIKGKINFNTIPWKLLNTSKKSKLDFKELALKQDLASKDFLLTAAKLNYIPDMTFSLGYTKRSNIDGMGDFVSASVAFPLPFSSKKYAMNARAVHEKYSLKKDLENFKRSKNRDIEITRKDIKKVQSEISILNKKTIKFAQNSRKITSKSYGLGNSTYLELLQSELKLQSILLKKVTLEASRDILKVSLKYILGESLHE